jgi:hypothetical protein
VNSKQIPQTPTISPAGVMQGTLIRYGPGGCHLAFISPPIARTVSSQGPPPRATTAPQPQPRPQNAATKSAGPQGAPAPGEAAADGLAAPSPQEGLLGLVQQPAGAAPANGRRAPEAGPPQPHFEGELPAAMAGAAGCEVSQPQPGPPKYLVLVGGLTDGLMYAGCVHEGQEWWASAQGRNGGRVHMQCQPVAVASA